MRNAGTERGGGRGADAYRTELQVCDMNALGAVLAVMRWKRLHGFYAGADDVGRSAYLVGRTGC